MITQEEIEKQLLGISDRNKKVEADKAWETSWTRRVFISLVTYAIAASWLLVIKENNFWLKTFVPVAGYILSTLSLPALKKWWLSKTSHN